MKPRSCVVVLLFLLAAPAAIAQTIPPPPPPDLMATCDGGTFVLHVSYFNYDPDIDSIVVRRVEAVPGLLGAAVLTPEPVATPFDAWTEFTLPDPGVDPEGLARYAVDAYVGEFLQISWTFDVSCAQYPLAMIGYLQSSTEFAPCTNHELLECDVVSLHYGDLNVHVGTGELLKVLGWPLIYGDASHCVLEVFAIESLGTGVGCGDVVPADDLSWSALKARYR